MNPKPVQLLGRLLAFTLIGGLVGCGVPDSIAGNQTSTEEAGTPAHAGRFPFPGEINCADVEVSGKSPEWNGLVIGETTREEFDVFTHPYPGILNEDTGSWDYWALEDNPTWFHLQACFTEDQILSVLDIGGHADVPRELQDWLDRYGPPDLVTWGYEYSSRSLLWSEEGVLATISVYHASTIRVLLFTPIPVEQLQNSWVFRSLPTDNRVIGGDFRPPSEEDPWSIEK